MVKGNKATTTGANDVPEITTTAVHGIALQAAVWGMPIVSMEAMRQAFFRDAQAEYGDVLYWSEPADWKLQLTTPNASSRYVWIQFNTHGGPVVLDLPAAVGAGLFGSINDAWQVPVVDVGPAGEDAGKGGKYLLLPPDYQGEVPSDHIAVRLATYNSYAALRAIPEGSTEADVQRALALVRKISVYPFSEEQASPPHQELIDMTGKLFDAIVRFDASFFASLARMLNEEPALARDAEILKQLELLGIQKGKEHAPEGAMQLLLNSAARDAQAHFMRQLPLAGTAFWADRKWRLPSDVGMRTGFSFVEAGELDIEQRALMFFLGCAPPAKLGKASVYLAAYVDRAGQVLSGDSTYTLHVPANVPARQFWAATVYDATTAAFVRESPRVEINSYDQRVQKSPDGSVDLYFGPTAPPGHETNWIPTPSGHRWFMLFRLYGPAPALHDQSWKLSDLEMLHGPRPKH
jgi:hypothetical protein